MMRKFTSYVSCMLLAVSMANAQSIPSPKEHFGFNIGDDYQLANYTQSEAFIKKLATSPRAKYVDIGLTEEGRHQFMLIVSSPENIKHLDKYKAIAQKLARAENLTDEQAHKLVGEGKAVVWIDGGLHASETVGSHQLLETAYEMVTRTDPQVMQILDKTIILFVHANPDGQELVANWYMSEKDPKKRNMNVPRLWEKYIGHDNNRDFFIMNMKESANIARQQYLEWMPEIIYNHHQAGPAGSVVAGPPYRDPFNYVFDPLLMTSIDGVGAAMVSRLNQEGKPGYTERNGTSFSTWWNGGLRTTAYFHNMVGLLTEIIGSPTPAEIPLVPERLIPNSNTPNPITPQPWHYKQSIDYSVSLNFAVLDYAVRNHDDLLFNSYRMGKNSIEHGSADYWTLSPKRAEAITALYEKDKPAPAEGATRRGGAVTLGGEGRGPNIPTKYFDSVLRNPTLRDPRGYIITTDQPDFPTTVKFINALIKSGILIQKATAPFTVAGKQYPAGSYIVKTDQAFRAHVIDMFEPQDHPNDFQYPGGPPIRPYDIAGWTLAFQMGVTFDRVLNGFTGPFERIPYGQLQNPPVTSVPSAAKNGYLLSGNVNNSFVVVNDLLNAGVQVFRVRGGLKGATDANAGTFFVPSSEKAAYSLLEKSAPQNGVKVIAAAKKPKELVKITPARIALWDTYGGSIPSGWIRWMMEQYHFPFKVVYPQEIDGGNLKAKYDVIVFVGGAIPAKRGGAGNGGGEFYGRMPKPEELPEEFRSMTGRITAEKSIPQLKEFLEAGGNIVTIGSSTNLAFQLNLPVKNALVEPGSDDKALPGDKFYIPGSILRVSLDTTQPANWGMFNEADVDFDSSPVFKLDADAAAKGVKPLAWYATDKPLLSGWAWGQKYLKDGVAAFTAPVGKGTLYAFGPEITFRGQSHNTFKMLFNELYNKPVK
jgi:hypothetical protein